MAIRKLELLCAFLNLNLMEACTIQWLGFFQASQNLIFFQSMSIEEQRKEMLIIMCFRLIEGTCVQFTSSPKTSNIKDFHVLCFPVYMGIINFISISVFSVFKVYSQVWLSLYFRWSLCLFSHNIHKNVYRDFFQAII